MSQYGPPGGQRAGQPHDPIRQHYGYNQPSDPLGGQEIWDTAPLPPLDGSGSPVVFAAGHDSRGPAPYQPDPMTAIPPEWTTPVPVPPKRKGNGLFIGVVAAVLAVLVLAAGGVVFYLLKRDVETVAANPTPDTSQPADAAVTEPTPSEPQATEPQPDASTDVRFVEVGQCVRNDGTMDQPRLVVTECAPRTYEVLARVDGATSGAEDAKRKCSSVPGYTQWYFYNAALDELDFVLCLKER